MKKIIFISATSNTNLSLAKALLKFVDNRTYDLVLLNLEEYNLPIYNPSTYLKDKNKIINSISKLTELIVSGDAFIICAPEYNGNVPPVFSNAIAWVSTMTDYWKDAFKNKNAFVASSSGGDAERYQIAMKNQLKHIGCNVFDKTIIINNSKPIEENIAKNHINQFIKLL